MKSLCWYLYRNREIFSFIYIHLLHPYHATKPIFFCFLPSHPLQPQARQASLSISMSPMGRWMRWCPTCLGEPRRTEASWKVPKRRGSCCGRSWNADSPLGSFSTDRCTENTEEETERGGCQRVEFFFFYFPWLTAAAVRSLPPVQPWMFVSCSTLSWSFLADGLFWCVTLSFCLLTVVFLHSVPRWCYRPSPPSSLLCIAHVLSILFLIRLCIHKHPSFCLPVVYRALVSIKWASLLLQKDSLKCQRDWGGRLFLSLYLSWRRTTIIKITGLI